MQYESCEQVWWLKATNVGLPKAMHYEQVNCAREKFRRTV